MFQGTLPQDVTSILHRVVQGWGIERIWVGYSGEFTIERSLLDLGKEYRGNDVSLFTSSLGLFLAGKEAKVSLSPEHAEDLAWLLPFMDTREGRAATIRLSQEMAEPWVRRHENSYWAGLAHAHQSQFGRMHEKVVKKLTEAKLKLADFYPEDVVQYQRRWFDDPKGGFISFPPVYVGGYERMFKHFHSLWTWHGAPDYPLFNRDALEGMIALAKQRDFWAMGTQEPVKSMEEFLTGVTQATPRGTKFYIYCSNTTNRQVVVPHQFVVSPKIPKADPTKLAGGVLGIFKLKQEEFASLRSQHLNPRIRPGAVTVAYGVTVDGRLLGVFAVDTSPKAFSVGNLDGPSVYLMPDFPVVKGKRVAKLVVFAALSREAQILMERVTKKRIRSITTTAFTEKPRSRSA
jgi:hypothetical protein